MASKNGHSPGNQRDYNVDREELGPELVKGVLLEGDADLDGLCGFVLGGIDDDVFPCSVEGRVLGVVDELIVFELILEVV